jgi:hypothetical protein
MELRHDTPLLLILPSSRQQPGAERALRPVEVDVVLGEGNGGSTAPCRRRSGTEGLRGAVRIEVLLRAMSPVQGCSSGNGCGNCDRELISVPTRWH